MCDQQIELLVNKLVKFIQDLTVHIQTIFNEKILNENFCELFQLRSDYAKQLACLFDILINRLIEEVLLNRTTQMKLNLDPVQIWQLIKCCINQLNDIQSQDLCLIIKHIEIINHFFYNFLLQLKSCECLNVDQIRILNQKLITELNCLGENLKTFITIFHAKIHTCSKPIDTYLFQSVSTKNYPNNNNSTKPTSISQPFNSNCYPPCSSSFSIQTNPIRYPTGTIPVYCGNNSQSEMSTSLCFPTPIVYTPEIETLFSSGGIIYARKSGNSWIAENLGTLVDTLKDIAQTIDMNEHCEILVRKTGDLVVRRKKGRQKQILEKSLFNNNTYEDMNRTY